MNGRDEQDPQRALRGAQALTASRRSFLRSGPLGLGGWALAAMASKRSHAAAAPVNPLAPKRLAHPGKAKAVIFVHLNGAPTQLEMFDWKPTLRKYDGAACPAEFLKGKRFAFIRGVPTLLATPYQFEQRGQAGSWVSELLPHFAPLVDDVAIIRSMTTDQFNHAPGELLMHTGNARLGNGSMGAWVTYGLGSESENLPGFVVLASGGKIPSAGKSVWGSGFLPSVYQGVQCRTKGDPVLYLSNPEGIDRSLRRRELDTLRHLNELSLEGSSDPELDARVAQYELAFRMQTSVPEVMDISKEPKAMLEMYGAHPGGGQGIAGGPPPSDAAYTDPTFANNCLLARRLVESGVRFVQLFDWGWDHHGSTAREDIRLFLPRKMREMDRPVAALLKDLKQRGLLDSTLVVWGGEFGRTPMRENRGGKYGAFVGRDHHPFAFTMWMAGGGIKGGLNYGATDDIGYNVVADQMTVHDLQATVLHSLGLDPYHLSYPFQGLDQRLIGPSGEAKIHHKLLS